MTQLLSHVITACRIALPWFTESVITSFYFIFYNSSVQYSQHNYLPTNPEQLSYQHSLAKTWPGTNFSVITNGTNIKQKLTVSLITQNKKHLDTERLNIRTFPGDSIENTKKQT